MTIDLKKFHQIVRERNEITTTALECAAFVLDHARRLSDGKQREPMLELVKTLISNNSEQ